MLKINLVVLATAALSCGAAFADSDSRWGSNSFSEEPRHSLSPGMVVEPWAGHPSEAMSTIDTRPGMVLRSIREATPGNMGNVRVDADSEYWSGDKTVYRSSAPEAAEHRYFAAYGDDIASLKGMQLELALNHLHHLDQMNIGMAKMAESKATTPEVLNLAHQIRADHESVETKVAALAARRDVNLEGFQLATYEQVVKNRLDKLEGAEFERAFLRVIDRSHDMNAAAVRQIRDDVNDPELTAIVDDALPAMHAHKEGSRIHSRASLEDGDIGEDAAEDSETEE